MVEIKPNQSLKDLEAELDKSIAEQTKAARDNLWKQIVEMNGLK